MMVPDENFQALLEAYASVRDGKEGAPDRGFLFGLGMGVGILIGVDPDDLDERVDELLKIVEETT